MKAIHTLKKLHWIETNFVIYNIMWRNAGVGIMFYEGERYADGYAGHDEWKKHLVVKRYYSTFEESVDAEYQRLGGPSPLVK